MSLREIITLTPPEAEFKVAQKRKAAKCLKNIPQNLIVFKANIKHVKVEIVTSALSNGLETCNQYPLTCNQQLVSSNLYPAPAHPKNIPQNSPARVTFAAKFLIHQNSPI